MAQLAAFDIVDERQALPVREMATLRHAFFNRGEEGRSPLVEADEPLPAPHLVRDPAAAWPFPSDTPPEAREPDICHVRDVDWFPAYGVLAGPGGRVLRSASGEALHRWPDLAPVAELMARRPSMTIERGVVFMPWGGGFNYGHFLLDAMPSMLAAVEHGFASGAPVLAPPLKSWQRNLLAAAFPECEVREVRGRRIRLDQSAYATSMDHFLHAPTALVRRVAERVVATAPEGPVSGRRVYLSRRSQSMRVMVNEAALEEALRRRGFLIVRPERMSALAQVALMRDAEVVVGASGAALANALFLRRGARVIEVQPANFTSRWVWAACRQVGVEWRGLVCPSPADPREASWLSRARRGFRFAYRPPLDELLEFIDAAL
ncbi:capsular biosynthesis protein [Caulobacter radicis]|uniref:glycosyltransferase family 61 protein n=1 Tax=Caulobacter radicis TaxID=2172650 RepID=UPI000D5670C6|nr:glycosyltransferase 61 family protein [Caulobacter radicis]PVM83929.1 capsular biosynthesis protein [Caulobacter radicis]